MIENIQHQLFIENYGRVIHMSDKLLGEDEYKNNYEVLMCKASAHQALYQDDEAILTLQEVIKFYPQEINPLLDLGAILLDNGKFLEGRSVFNKALALDTKNLEILDSLIYIEMMLDNNDEVLRLVNMAIEIEPSNPTLWVIKADTHQRLGQFQEGISCAEITISHAGDDPLSLVSAYNTLGYIYSKMNDLDNAEYYLKEALELDPDSSVYCNLGWVFAQKGDVELGLKYVLHSIDMDDSNSYAYKNLAKIYLMKNESQKAIKYLEKAKALGYALDVDKEVDELLIKINLGKKM